MPAEFPGILKFTGWREPISISGAGKVVDGILRRRPCFLCPEHWPGAAERRQTIRLRHSRSAPQLPCETRIDAGGATWQRTGSRDDDSWRCCRDRRYPARSLLRYGLDVLCSISQNIQTNAAPRQITISKNSNVNAGAVSMFNILDQMQTVYQRTELKPRPR